MSIEPLQAEIDSETGDSLVQTLRRRLENRLTSALDRILPEPVPSADVNGPIGRVVSIDGAKVVAMLDVPNPERELELSSSLQIGCVVKLPAKRATVFGMINGLTIPVPTADGAGRENKFLELDLVGESMSDDAGNSVGIRRGVSTYPALGGPVYAATPEDLRFVFVRDDPGAACIGRLHQDRELPAQIDIDDLLGKHFAVLGATGTGKSCAVTIILRAILDRNPSAHVLLLDPHNEYRHAFGDRANIIDLQTLRLPYWLFSFGELRAVLNCAGAKITSVESALLNELIVQAKRQLIGSTMEERHVTADTPTPYRMTQVSEYIGQVLGRLDKPENVAPYETLKTAIATLQNDVRYSFMFGKGVTTRDLLIPILSNLFRVPVEGKPVTILDLSTIPSEILNLVVSVLCRTTYEFALWSRGRVPVLLVCDEAHLYAPEDSEEDFEPTKRALSRIAKEGRKYGISLCLASQRPAEIAAGMLAQCSTIFAMRLTYERDQQWLSSALSDNVNGLLGSLASLGTGEAIAVGEGIPLPMRLVFDHLSPEERPRSATAVFTTSWKADIPESDAFLHAVVDSWRRQRHDG